jgi:hypothetical protein
VIIVIVIYSKEFCENKFPFLKRAHFKKGGIFLALKGLHIPAQGNALGNY